MSDFTCTICAREFGSQEALDSHNSAKHALTEKSRPLSLSQVPVWKIAAIVFVALFVVGIAWLAFSLPPPSNDLRVPQGAIHWHPVLEIVINGQKQTIPANLGASGTVHHPIHTHDSSGELHYENNSPTLENMRLKYFFETVWNKRFDKECIFDYCNGVQGTVKMLVNGVSNDEFESFIPKDGDRIRIEYSAP